MIDNRLKILWLMFAFFALMFVQQCSVMIISKPGGDVNVDHEQAQGTELTGKEKVRNVELDTINPVGLY